MSRSLRRLVLVLACAASVACGGAPYDEGLAAEQEAPLGGEALLQRRNDLARALSDLEQFHATMATMIDRNDAESLSRLDDFLARYLDRHVEPLLRPRWQSRNAELAAVDASLRFARAEVLIQLRYPGRVQDAIEDIESRYGARPGMLVDYPIGEQGTLGKALEILKDRKWKG